MQSPPAAKTGILPHDPGARGTVRAPAAGRTESASPRPVLQRRVLTVFGLFEAFVEPAVAVAWLAVCVLLVGDYFDSRYLIMATIAFSLAFPGAMRFNDPGRTILAKALRTSLLLVGGLALFGYATGYLHLIPRAVKLSWAGGLPLALLASQLAVRWLLPPTLRALNAETSAVICGANAAGLQLADHFSRHHNSGWRFLGFFDDRSHARLDETGKLPLLGKLDQLADFVKGNNVQRVFVALPMASQPRVLRLIEGLRDTTASIYFVPDVFITPLINGRLQTLSGLPVIAVCETPFRGVDGLLKRIEDLVVASLALVLAAPVLLAVAIGVRLSSPGPILFRQRRYGLDGRRVWVYKFRSMSVTEDGDRVFRAADRDDPRITRFGAFIRRTSLDELPQLMNVLQGRMSIVGPRPHAVAMNEEYRKLIPSYMLRHKIKPGITGLAQVRGYRGGDDLEHMKKRIACDIEYLRDWSPALDLWIILKTVGVLLRDRSAY